ncbi:MAG: toll/interleukin-1 receptor domain-containing protein, partial [Vicinamibacterales bacterium]
GFRDVWFANLTHWSGEPDGEAFFVLKRLVEARLNSTLPADRTRAVPSIFVCYRREDTQDAAGRLHDRLVDAFGPERVFMDIDSVPLGIDFVEHVAEQIGKCSAVIVMIGKQWHTIKDKKRRRRLDNEDDLVRAEIRSALQQKIAVIPVTVQNAAMPQAEDLPDDIRLLARRNGIQLDSARWRTDVDRLIKELDRVMQS